jgi:predicted phosphodiesterase
MKTAVISDLHLGCRSHTWLLSRPDAREILAESLESADRLVLLGDLLELRESPLADVLEAAAPALEAIGRAMAGREVVIVPGNHDHQLAAPLLDELRVEGSLRDLGVERIVEPPDRGAVGRIAQLLGPAKVRLAYPGVWLRDDVYAMHGHYLDCHNTIPTMECLAVAATTRAIGGLPNGRRIPADYEAAIGPTYALTYTLAQSQGPVAKLLAGRTTLEAWKRLNGSGGPAARSRLRRLGGQAISRVVFPGAVAAINRAGLGPFEADISGAALRRAGLHSIRAAIEALGIDAAHVVFGHTHRSGPQPGEEADWQLPGGGGLVNSGSWIHEPAFLGHEPKRSPYWPGTSVWVEDGAAPELRRLVD